MTAPVLMQKRAPWRGQTTSSPNTSYCPVPGLVSTSPANRDYQPGFTADMMIKDLKLSQQAAQAVGASTPLGAEATALYSLFSNSGNGQLDFSGIIKLIAGK